MKKNDLAIFNKFIKHKASNANISRNVVLYTRVSSKEQADTNGSLEFQIKELREFSERNNYIVVAEFGGTYESASDDFSRREFSRLISYVKSLKSSLYGIVVSNVSRFSRSGGDAVGILSELGSLNIHLVDASSGIDSSTARGRLQIENKLLESRVENLNKVETIVPRMKAYLKKGKSFGISPFGYTHYGPRVTNPDHYSREQKIIINNDGLILKEAFELKMTGNYSDAQILEFFQEKGLVVSKQKLSRIWRNPFYCGVSVNRLLDEPEKGNWEKLISVSDFERIQAVLEKNNSNYNHKKRSEYKPLSRFLKCNDCGRYLESYINNDKKLSYYRCAKCKSSLNMKTSKYRIGSDDLFIGLLDQYRVDPRAETLIERQLNKVYAHFNDEEIKNQNKLTIEITNLNNKLENLMYRFGSGEVDRQVYDLTRSKLESQITDLRLKIDQLNPQISNQEIVLKESFKKLRNLSELWEKIGFDNKQKLQKVLFPDGIYYRKENHDYLTKEVNSFLLVTKSLSTSYVNEKKRTDQEFNDLSYAVAGTGIEDIAF